MQPGRKRRHTRIIGAEENSAWTGWLGVVAVVGGIITLQLGGRRHNLTFAFHTDND